MDKRYLYGKKSKTGALASPDCGRIIIYGKCISISRGPSMDHNDLLRSFIARWGLRIERDRVISRASRYYYYQENGCIYISPIRKTDDDDFMQNHALYTALVAAEIRRSD